MGDLFEWWITGGDWYDRKQRREIEGLHARQSAQAASLRTQMQRQSQDLAGRIANLERALAAVLELEDTREQLTGFADCAVMRRHARDVVAQLATLGGAGAASPIVESPADVTDYWLHPAVRALSAVIHPGTGDVDGLVEEARRRNASRTDLFAVCVASLAGSPQLAARHLASPIPDGDITAEERTIWRAAAAGRLGPEVASVVADRLRARLDAEGVSPEARRAIVENGLRIRPTRDRSPKDAAALLSDLRARVVGDAPTDVTTEGAADGPNAPPDVADDPLAEVLAVLVNEGAPREVPILDAMGESRAALQSIGIAQAPSRVQLGRSVGSVTALLTEDLGATDGTGRAGFAARVLAESVVAFADELRGEAVAPPPTSATTTISGRKVDVRVGDRPPSPSPPRRGETAQAALWFQGPRLVLLGAGAVAVLGLVLAVVIAPGWIVLTIAAAVAAAVAARNVVQDQKDRATTQAVIDRRTTSEYERVQRELTEAQAAAEEARTTAPTDLAAVRDALLTEVPGASSAG